MATKNQGNFSDKITFFNKLGTLMRATSADNEPTPAYLYDEINSLTWQSSCFCSDLLDYFCARMEENNCMVKKKSLLLMKYLVENGHDEFKQNLRKNSTVIREASTYHGPPDALHGNVPYIEVRENANKLLSILFEIVDDYDVGCELQNATVLLTGRSSPQGSLGRVTSHSQSTLPPPIQSLAGMGYEGVSAVGAGAGKMEGFGNTVQNVDNKTLGDVIMHGMRDLVERINNSDDPPSSGVHSHLVAKSLDVGMYRPVHIDKVEQINRIASIKPPDANPPKEHRPGVAGGGWDFNDVIAESNHQSSLKSSNDSTELSERLASVSMNDSIAEHQIIDQLILGQSTAIPTRDQINAFIDRSSCVSCDKLVELMNEHLLSDNEIVVVRCLVFLEYLMRSDLISVDNLAWICHKNLMQLFQVGTQQPQLKARKVIRQLERLATNSYLFMDSLPTSHIDVTTMAATTAS